MNRIQKMVYPKIKVKVDKEHDKELFRIILNPESNPPIAAYLLDRYPNLKSLFERHPGTPKEEVVNKFVNYKYRTRENDIMIIANRETKRLRVHGQKILHALTRATDFRWEKSESLRAFFSILPYSQSLKDTLSISIFNELYGPPMTEKDRAREYLYAFAHELLHVIFKKKFEVYRKKGTENIDEFEKNALSETFAPIIMNSGEAVAITKKEAYPTLDYDLLQLSVNGKALGIVKLFESIYKEGKSAGRSFDEILLEALSIIREIRGALQEKREIWKRGEYNEEKLAATSYEKPIALKRKGRGFFHKASPQVMINRPRTPDR